MAKKEISTPIIELHKTDYNNYADLGHFIEQYNIAQEIIKECGKFYKSFLVSKLMNWEQLINYQYRNTIDFTYRVEYDKELSSVTYNRILDIYLKYLDEHDHVGLDDWYYNKGKNLKKLVVELDNIPAAEKELKKLNKDEDTIGVNLANAINDNIPYDKLKIWMTNPSSKITKNSWWTWKHVIDAVYESKTSTRPNYYVSKANFTSDEIKWCIKQYEDVVINMLNPIRAKIEVLEKCIAFTKNKQKERLGNDLIEKLKTLNLPKGSYYPKSADSLNSCSVYFKEFEYSWETNKISTNSYSKHLNKTRIIDENDFHKLMVELEDYVLGQVRANKLEHIYTDKKDYFVIVNGKLEPFSNDLTKVNIQLSDNQKELICKDVQVSTRKKYKWPSDAPTIKTTQTTTLIFNTGTNEVKKYDIDTDTEEIKNKYYDY